MSDLPAIFVSHGAPTLPLDDVPARDFLRGLSKLFPAPKAILVASAHWETPAPAVSLATKPETVHDFYGFPRELYAMSYPAPGAPEVAAKAKALLDAAGLAAAGDPGQGLDHGAWVPLLLAWPDAEIPVAQVAIQPHLGPAHHVAIGRALAPLRKEGVLILGSGGAVHNLRRLERSGPPPEWAKSFDDWLAANLEAGDEAALVDYRARAPNAEKAHPRDEHLIPVFVAYGAGGKGAKGKRIHASFTHGALSLAAFSFG
ncbi:MAG: dioxygenase [Rhodospirillales bacterium]|nr:dioxygenase [Rhodospirillales bacterium]